MVNKTLVVIGGGASGFFTAVNATHPQLNVIIVEKTAKLLSKVAVSGGGRCNVTNSCDDLLSFSKHYPRGEKFLKKTLHHFNNQSIIQWFAKRGVKLVAEADGRMFPHTNTSQTIVDTLLQEAVKHDITIYTKTAVESVEYKDGQFNLMLNNGITLQADFLCIATGGQQKLAQYDWLSFSNAEVAAPVPSLFTFNMPKHSILPLAGISIAQATVKIVGSKIQTEGPILVTHWGLSGPAVLKASAWGANLLQEKNYQFDIQINWIAPLKEDEVIGILLGQSQGIPNTQIENKNPFKLPARLWQYFLACAGVKIDIKWGQLPAKERNALAKILTNMIVPINGKTTFKEEFVTAGGVEIANIDVNTMMSKQIENLYFVGEILNVDGITGGYNFQNAWTTGWIASQSIINKL